MASDGVKGFHTGAVNTGKSLNACSGGGHNICSTCLDLLLQTSQIPVHPARLWFTFAIGSHLKPTYGIAKGNWCQYCMPTRALAAYPQVLVFPHCMQSLNEGCCAHQGVGTEAFTRTLQAGQIHKHHWVRCWYTTVPDMCREAEIHTLL